MPGPRLPATIGAVSEKKRAKQIKGKHVLQLDAQFQSQHPNLPMTMPPYFKEFERVHGVEVRELGFSPKRGAMLRLRGREAKREFFDTRGRPRGDGVIDCSSDAWELFRSLYLQQNGLSLKACWSFLAGEWCSLDGRVLDVMGRVPDSRTGWRRHRFVITGLLDMRSRKLCGWDIRATEDSDGILSGLKMAFRECGAWEHAIFDCGEAYKAALGTPRGTRKQRAYFDDARIRYDEHGLRIGDAHEPLDIERL